MTNLNARQLKAIALLAEGNTVKFAAESVQCTSETICIWKRIPAFEAILNQKKQEILDSAVTNIQSQTLSATRELGRLACSAKSEEVRRKACLDLIELAGIKDPRTGMFGWKVGPTTEQEIIDDKNGDSKMKKLLDSYLSQ